MDNVLKGNFQVKRPIDLEKSEEIPVDNLTQQLKKRALASLGGSMVYVEREQLNWDGND